MLLWNKYSAVTSAAQTSQQKIILKKANTKRFTSVPQTQSTHTTNQPVWWVFTERLLWHKCVWHKTRPACEYEKLERMAASEEKEPVMP